MKDANLYVLLALSAERNAILEKRIKGFEINTESISNEVDRKAKEIDRQAKEIESLRQPKKTYHGKPYLRKAA